MEKNKRIHPRFTVQDVDGTMTSASRVEVVNMSISGIAIQLDRSLQIGREYTIRINSKADLFSLTGQVVWCTLSAIKKRQRGDGSPLYSAGLRFTDAVSPQQTRLLEFLDEHWVGGEKRLGGLRFRIDAPGAVFLDVPQRYTVRLISMTGALISLDRELAQGEKYPMEITLAPGQTIKFEGRIASCLSAPGSSPSVYEIGVAFEEMDTADERRLKSFLATLKE